MSKKIELINGHRVFIPTGFTLAYVTVPEMANIICFIQPDRKLIQININCRSTAKRIRFV